MQLGETVDLASAFLGAFVGVLAALTVARACLAPAKRAPDVGGVLRHLGRRRGPVLGDHN